MIGAAPPVVAFTLIGYVPKGVPGFPTEPLPELPQEASHKVEHPRTATNPTTRSATAQRFREPKVSMMPNNPGSRAA